MANENIQTTLQVSTTEAFDNLVLNENTAYATSRAFTRDELPYGVNLYARVKHTHATLGAAAWSPTRHFTIKVPANVIGVTLDNTQTKGVLYWVDINGNKVDSFDWRSHPTFTGMENVIEDSSRAPVTLLKIPKFYVKTAASGPTGTFSAGKMTWWLSDLPLTGFRPHVAFKRSVSKDSSGKYIIADYIKVGRYLGHSETVGGKTCIGSKVGQTVLASQTKANFKTYITNRNNAAAGQSGWRMFDIYDIGALRYLSIIATCSTDSQACWGDNSAGVAYPKTGSTNARMVFKGTHADPQVAFEDAWRCYWYHCDLIVMNSGVVSLTSPMDLTSTLTFNSSNKADYTASTAGGWIRSVLSCPFTCGDTASNIQELFVPATVVSAENQGTFSDYHWGEDEYGNQLRRYVNGVMKGGQWNDGSVAGIDTMLANVHAPSVGSRLSKS